MLLLLSHHNQGLARMQTFFHFTCYYFLLYVNNIVVMI